MATTTALAEERLRLAVAVLREVEQRPFCCDASRNQALGQARKQVKRWQTWLADEAVLDGAADETSEED